MDNIYAIFAVSLLLLIVSALMMTSHVRAWRRFQREELDAEEFNYRRRQFRRRMQTSAMIALLVIAISVGDVLTHWIRSGLFALFILGLTLLLVCWVCLLALVDIWATKHYFGRLRHKNFLEQTKLQAELWRLEAGKRNGEKRKR